MFHLFSLKNVLRNFAVHSCPPPEECQRCLASKKLWAGKETPPCTKIIIRQRRHSGMSSRLLRYLPSTYKHCCSHFTEKSRSVDDDTGTLFFYDHSFGGCTWAIFLLCCSAVSNNRLADFITLTKLDFNYMKLMTYRKMQLDSTLQKSFLIRIMHRIYNTTTLPHCNNASQTGKPNK